MSRNWFLIYPFATRHHSETWVSEWDKNGQDCAVLVGTLVLLITAVPPNHLCTIRSDAVIITERIAARTP